MAEPASECTLLLAVPTTLEDFARRVVACDWLAKFAPSEDDEAARRHSIEAAWQKSYGPFVAEPLQHLQAVAADCGVRVLRGATLADVAAATRESRTIIVFAHWRGPEIVRDDIVATEPLESWLARASASSEPLADTIAQALRRDIDEPPAWHFWNRPRPRSLVEILSDVVDAPLREAEVTSAHVDGVRECVLTTHSRRRDQIDRVFTGLLRPGNRIELYDGLHDCPAFEAAIDRSFTGCLDLTTCSSSVLADHVLRKRRNLVRLVQFDHEQTLLWHSQVVAIALPLHLVEKMPYGEARKMADTLLRSALSGGEAMRGHGS